MGKGTDLWDDSALINAFDHAMATYTEMHSSGSHGNSAKEGNHTSEKIERALSPLEKEAGHVEPGDSDNNVLVYATKTHVPYDNTEVASDNLSNQGNNFVADSHASESEPCSSGFPCMNEKTYSYSDQQSLDYNQLLRQYYELEDQKQKVVQQLHQANYWNYQTPVQSSTCQLPQVSGYNVPENGLQTPCSLCSCHCIAVPLMPTTYTGGGLSAGGYGSPQLACCFGSQAHQDSDDSAVKVGMLAVERAVKSMTAELSATSSCSEGKREKDVSAGILEGNVSQCISSDTDLTAVLNAWYLAGFHTGRYLSEQSKENAHH